MLGINGSKKTASSKIPKPARFMVNQLPVRTFIDECDGKMSNFLSLLSV